ncbi:MAG: alpha/beta fold hydrolase [Deltaproteobacteria bacterium]|jgi:haloalkane dehalogenase|nr:alpha/beta fold hydrolase [Deltaproteobacteria bacterium]MDL1986876.1 alpha/beta fold hydrolase [Deltaproteobacteria bacterium]
MKTNRPVDISHFRHLYPFKPNYMDLDGLKYHFVDEGSGDPIIMIHGNPTWSFYYRNLVTALSPQFRTIAVDHIGCGLSDKPDTKTYDYRLKTRINDLETLLDRLNLKEKLTLVVHDWGGMIGMAYAIKYPERIKRIIIMNTAAFFPPKNKKLPVRLRLIRDVCPFARLAVLGFNIFAYSALFMATRKGLSKDVKSGLIAPYNCWKNRIATLKFVQDIPLSENDPGYNLVKHVDKNLHKLSDIPMLICWGRHDFVFDLSYLAEWQRRFPDAEVHTFSEAGHYVLEDEPEKVIALVKEFLEKYPI